MRESASAWSLACVFFAFCGDEKGGVKGAFYREARRRSDAGGD